MPRQGGFIGVGVLVAILAGLIVIGGGVYWFMHQQATPEVSGNSDDIQSLPNVNQTQQTQTTANTSSQSTHTQSSANATSSVSYKTVEDSNYGFWFEYPVSASFARSGYDSIKPFSNPPVDYIQMTDGLQTEGYLTINVSTSSSNVAECTTPGALVWIDTNVPAADQEKVTGNAANVTINGTTFLRYDVTSHDIYRGAERDYTAVRNGACYDIQLTAFPGACVNSGCTDRTWSAQTEASLLNQLDASAQTFTFMDQAALLQ